MKPLLLIGALVLPVSAAEVHWDGIRDASLYLSPSTGDELRIRWQPAWQAAANPERIYLLDGQGRLQAERSIAADQLGGELSWPLAPGGGPYRLEIPGYSFRRFQVEHSDATQALLAPAKVHFAAEPQSDLTLYFRVKANQRAILGGKYHDGVRRLQVERLSDRRTLRLPLTDHSAYWRFDRLPLPLSGQDETWRLTLQGNGKAAFWLDGTDNLFAQSASQLAELPLADGQATLVVGDKVLGRTPDLGVALPYHTLPASAQAPLSALSPQAGGFYSLVDIMAERPLYENLWRRLYQDLYGIDHDITLLAARGRVAELEADRTTLGGLDAWLAATRMLGGQGVHYLAFADEPNLNYRDYASFSRYFQIMAERVRTTPGAYQAGVRIAMPASSRLLGGPFAENADSRRGIDWARRLLQEHGQYIDALAWHEWMVRDLLATRSYRDSVRQAAALVGLDDHGRPRKALLLDQTNMSSGASLSPYDQNTHYGALWWTSVVINASADGLLDMLNWFHVADEPGWPKGMLSVTGVDRFELKPAGRAQQFIARHWLEQVLALDNDAFELDALAMAEGAQRVLLGVNKADRLQHVSLRGVDCGAARLELFGPHDQPRQAGFDCSAGQMRFQLPGQTVFAFAWSVP